jgi:DNA ligase D-like protein (predicted 3'-phosphoesterase)
VTPDSRPLQFVVQEHHARSHHFDLRLEKDGVFKSWAVPKGVPEPGVRRLAIQVDDHALTFGDFEGEIPPGEYGAGNIRVWDCGDYEPVEWAADRIVFDAHGTKMSGRFRLVRFRRGGPSHWLLMKSSNQALRFGTGRRQTPRP